MGLPSGIVKCNIPICDLIKIVKPVIRQLVEDCKYFFFYISFLNWKSPVVALKSSSKDAVFCKKTQAHISKCKKECVLLRKEYIIPLLLSVWSATTISRR